MDQGACLTQGITCPGAGVLTTTDVEEATKGVEVAVMVGGFPRKAGMERKDVMAKNVSIYKSQASALEKNAAPGLKVLPLLWCPPVLPLRSLVDFLPPAAFQNADQPLMPPTLTSIVLHFTAKTGGQRRWVMTASSVRYSSMPYKAGKVASCNCQWWEGHVHACRTGAGRGEPQ
jgi:hypothetical protein